MDFRQKVVYQIYPKSFNDSNGDGFGDLQGVIQRIPYLKDLGVDVVWFTPFFSSPQNDNGYDISDYCAIDPRFGTMEDFEVLMQSLKDNGMEMMLDMVLNHVSIEHEWFQNALAGDKRYQDYFIIRDAKEDGSEPTNWQSKFGGNAWAPFGDTGRYYLHLYDVTQADLNWRNPEVRQELANVVNFWIDKGVSAFRFDVINVIGKDEELVDAEDGIGKSLYTDRPIVHDYLQELNARTFGRIDSITVGEMSSTSIDNCIMYTQPERHELNMTFNFHHLKVDYEQGEKWSLIPYRFDELKGLLHEWNEKMAEGNGWNAWFWNNHDQPRALTRFTDDDKYRNESATMLATAVHLNRGTPFIYQGEEIGMTDPYFNKIEDYRDVESLNAYDILREKGYSEEEALHIIQVKSRDNSRTPMQWNDEQGAGFTTGIPWLNIGRNWPKINAKNEVLNGKIYPYYKQLIQMRKQYNVIAFGDYHAYQPEHPDIYAFTRALDGEEWLVVLNFKEKNTHVQLEEEWVNGEIMIHNYEDRPLISDYILQPYEAVAIKKASE